MPIIRSPLKFLFWMLAGMFFTLFVCGGVISGYYFFDTVRDYIASSDLPSYGSVIPNLPSQNNPLPAAPALPNVTSGERINVLMLGIDRRPGEQGPWRTDTMIVATLAPSTKTGGMLTIPRDLYVPIPAPGAGQSRINTANYYGDQTKYPGGGPGLAKKTVEYNFAIPIHYYVLIDFNGFRRIVDTLGGIDIDVPVPIEDNAYPTEDYGVTQLYIPAGRQQMDGELALKYARSRHSTSDFDRSKRQMQILIAIREKALKVNALAKAPQLLSELREAIETDLTPEQILELAPIAAQVRPDNIKTRSIDQSMTYEIKLNTGADVLWPDREKIGVMLQELFSSPTTTNVAVVNPLQAEAARIVVLNGTSKDGLAALAARYLKTQGLNVVQIGNAERRDYKQTVVVDLGNKPATRDWLVKHLNVAAANVKNNPQVEREFDLRIILGVDWTPPLE